MKNSKIKKTVIIIKQFFRVQEVKFSMLVVKLNLVYDHCFSLFYKIIFIPINKHKISD